jgi:hypothetical protein
MGSTRDARRAGIKPAMEATSASRRIIAAKVAGSVDCVAKRSEEIDLAAAKEAMVPTAIPSSAKRRVFETTPN